MYNCYKYVYPQMQTSTEDLCAGLHPVFRDFLVYSRNLEFSMKVFRQSMKNFILPIY